MLFQKALAESYTVHVGQVAVLMPVFYLDVVVVVVMLQCFSTLAASFGSFGPCDSLEKRWNRQIKSIKISIKQNPTERRWSPPAF